jgi:hypothetical protein
MREEESDAMILISDNGKVLLDDELGGADYKAEKPKRITLEDVVGHYEPQSYITDKDYQSLVCGREHADDETVRRDVAAFKIPWNNLMVGRRWGVFPDEVQSFEEAIANVKVIRTRMFAAELAVRRELRDKRIGIHE